MNFLIRFWKDENGQAMMEAAVVVPLLLFMFLSLFFFHMTSFGLERAYMAARHGAYMYSMTTSDSQAKTKAVKAAKKAYADNDDADTTKPISVSVNDAFFWVDSDSKYKDYESGGGVLFGSSDSDISGFFKGLVEGNPLYQMIAKNAHVQVAYNQEKLPFGGILTKLNIYNDKPSNKDFYSVTTKKYKTMQVYMANRIQIYNSMDLFNFSGTGMASELDGAIDENEEGQGDMDDATEGIDDDGASSKFRDLLDKLRDKWRIRGW